MKSREESLKIAALKEFDLLVIGGGIVGAGIAQNAAARGVSVAIIEKGDFASGTSSRTTKLIHGGLRYLEQLRVRLIQQLCKERELLGNLAPHLIHDASFVLPLFPSNVLFNLRANIGLALYDLLAGSSGAHYRHERLSPSQVTATVPALAGNVFGGLKFWDKITDDSRMVLAVIKSACSYGAIAINYLEAKAFKMRDNKISGLLCHDRFAGDEIFIACKTCVNAAGVWSAEVSTLATPARRTIVKPSKGVHIVISPSKFETNSAVVLPAHDHRYIFLVPWQRSLLIGTTDSPYNGDLDNPLPEVDEIDYLLAAVNNYLVTHQLYRSDINATFAGLRPLVNFHPTSTSGDTVSLSREHLIYEEAHGLTCVVGGKLTNYRLMAEEVLERVVPKLTNTQILPSRTESMMLGGWLDKQDFLTKTAMILTMGRKFSLEPATLEHLISSYGIDAKCIIELIEKEPSLAERICPDFPPIMAEVAYGVACEMAISLSDILLRRLRLAVLHQKQCLQAAPKVAKLMEQLLAWDKRRTAMELAVFQKQMQIYN